MLGLLVTVVALFAIFATAALTVPDVPTSPQLTVLSDSTVEMSFSSNLSQDESSITSLHDGFSSGRLLTATAHHRYLLHTEVTTDDTISTNGTWTDVKDSSLTFTLAEPATLRLLYSMSVKPDYVNPKDEFGMQDDLSACLLIDGYGYRETRSFTTIMSHSFATAQLSRDVVLDLKAGTHTVTLQWRKWGNYARNWRSAPSFLDGYASSRILAVHGERKSIDAIQSLSFATISDNAYWHTVSDKVMSFTLYEPTTVLFSYGLPVTQMGNPTLDDWTYERWAEIGARLVVDSIPYVHSASSVDGTSQAYDEMRGSLVLALPAGSHTVALQWRVFKDDDAVSWTSLNRVTLGYQGGEELLMLVNHHSNEPTLVVPEAKRINSTLEDTVSIVTGTFISNINPTLTDEYNVGLTVTCTFGVISLNTVRELTFSVGDGTEDEVMYFSGS
ncbi:hypothetical protein TrCOL_g5273, partial [Triparma columacea]